MANLTTVTYSSGSLANTTTGTVSTVDALMADGGQATLGAKADAANTATDTTAVSAVSIWKQISKTLQAAAAAASTAFFSKITDGTSTAAVKAASTAPAATDPALVVGLSPNCVIGAQADAANTATDTTAISAQSVWKQISKSVQQLVTNTVALGRHNSVNSTPVVEASLGRQLVNASSTATVLGTTGAVGDYLDRLICVVSTAASSQVQITDGTGSAQTVLPNAVGPGVGTYTIYLGFTSASGAWKLTTGAGVAVFAVGDFT